MKTTTGSQPRRSASSTTTRRLLLLSPAVGLVGVDLVAKVAAQRSLVTGEVVSLGPLDLRLLYNSGTGFGRGANLPSCLVSTMVSVITASVAVVAWREAARGSLTMVVGLAAILAGEVANLLDRASDGV